MRQVISNESLPESHVTWQDWIDLIPVIAASNSCFIIAKNKYTLYLFVIGWLFTLAVISFLHFFIKFFNILFNSFFDVVFESTAMFLAASKIFDTIQDTSDKRWVFSQVFILVIDQVVLIRHLQNQLALSFVEQIFFWLHRTASFFVNGNAMVSNGWIIRSDPTP